MPIDAVAPLPPSPWVVRHGGMIPPGGTVLDVAGGAGRHGRFFRDLGHPVVMLDRDIGRVADMASDDAVEIVAQDLEDGRPWPLTGRLFAGVVVVNYLQAILGDLVETYAGRGVNLVRHGTRWCFRTAGDLGGMLRVEQAVRRKLSRAAVETLAIIAYHQPATRAEVEEIRIVDVTGPDVQADSGTHVASTPSLGAAGACPTVVWWDCGVVWATSPGGGMAV